MCVWYFCLLALAACEFFMTFKFWFCFLFFFFNSFLRRGFGMSSNLWYKYRLLVLGSATYTLKPLNSEDNCFRVIPCTCATLKTRLGLWEQLTKFWKDAICFLWISLFTCLPAQASQGGARDCAGTGPVPPRGHLFSRARLLQFYSARQLPSVIDCFCFVCLFLKCEALGPNC